MNKQAWRDIPFVERPWVIYAAVRQLQPLADAEAIQQEIAKDYEETLNVGWINSILASFEREGFLRSELRPHPDAETHQRRGEHPVLFYFTTRKRRPARKKRSSPGDGLRFAIA